MNRRFGLNRAAGLACLALVLGMMVTGCTTVKQARSVEESGFLGEDYSLLQKGGKGKPLMYYANPAASWASYKKVLLEPVVFYEQVDDPSGESPSDDIRVLVDNFSNLTYTELARDYTMVSDPGPGVMRIQIALTDVQRSHAPLQTVTSMIPTGLAITTTRNFITGKPSFVGEASVEVKITDASTEEVLGLAVDRRVGGQRLKLSVDSWVDVHNILTQWSHLLRSRLCSLRGGTDCPVK